MATNTLKTLGTSFGLSLLLTACGGNPLPTPGCLQEYAPVCAGKNAQVQEAACVAAPCQIPFGPFSTYPNQCEALADKATIMLLNKECDPMAENKTIHPSALPLCAIVTTTPATGVRSALGSSAIGAFKTFTKTTDALAAQAIPVALGICNTREGKTATGNDVPSCGVVTAPSAPQPTPKIDAPHLAVGTFQTFESNDKATAAKAYFLQEGSCADREHLEATSSNIAVCAKAPLVCVTTPCPDGLYQTFSTRQQATTAGATFVKWGGCGALEGTFDKPVQ